MKNLILGLIFVSILAHGSSTSPNSSGGGGTPGGSNGQAQYNSSGSFAGFGTVSGGLLSAASVANVTNDSGQVLTGYTSGAGTVAATDTLLQAIQKLNGNDALALPVAGGTMNSNANITFVGTGKNIYPTASATVWQNGANTFSELFSSTGIQWNVSDTNGIAWNFSRGAYIPFQFTTSDKTATGIDMETGSGTHFLRITDDTTNQRINASDLFKVQVNNTDQLSITSPGVFTIGASGGTQQHALNTASSAASNCGTLVGATGCVDITINGTTRHIPYF